MPRLCPYPRTLFSLVPVNEQARKVVTHPFNSHLVSILKDGRLGLDIGPYIRSNQCSTLATLGRGEADIFVEGPSIARVQCSFEIVSDTNIVLLYDRSHNQTTQVFGENSTPFEHGRTRKVVVLDTLNNLIGMGGRERNLVQFELVWHINSDQSAEKLKNREDSPRSNEENSRLAPTLDDARPILPPQYETAAHTPGYLPLKIRYKIVGQELGSGAFGTVHKAINIDSGKLMAVKILREPSEESKQAEWKNSVDKSFRGEVVILSKISHPNIVEFITSQGWGGPEVEIFMGLKEGTLESLTAGGSCSQVIDSAFHQMLQALDALAFKGIIHHDVKPSNVLYVLRPNGQYLFQLGDFGLCNRVSDAASIDGTYTFIAPEIWEGEQTPKSDIWSLFVTMMWVLDVGEFQRNWNKFWTSFEIQQIFLSAASTRDDISIFREMAIIEPEERASAAQMLVKYYKGEGLSTPRDQIPPLTSSIPTAPLQLWPCGQNGLY